MRRDYFQLDVENIDWVETDGDPEKPLVQIDFRGPDESLRERLTGTEGSLLEAEETDVAYRLQDSIDDPDAAGVVSVTNRITGDFVLELNEEADDVLRFIRAAREYGQYAADPDEGRYRVEISADGEHTVSYEKQTFLVYDADGNLLRGQSLIPSGVEL
ncbi:hypothetical protein SAMN04488063_1095 [Halopelagius inordinatus]|uniref:Uncharacterized protein n=1 Tax=Halopelagius inordinatus TaxID=553467 RepID=A0A1I2NAW2_9EURY|nr:DUF5793 family protein [Halopelagius inordinatus]SFG00210.1 hypothetical protein SAMN04488063_1095 [Halopelagius inordinatus]